MKIILLLILPILMMVSCISSDSSDSSEAKIPTWSFTDASVAELDELTELLVSNTEGMGSLAITKNGEKIYSHAFGYSDISENIKNTTDTKFRIGSISKTFTGVIIMQLIEESKLSLNTKLNDYFPNVKNAANITVEHLLRHRSGIFNFTESSDFITWMEKPITRSDLIIKIESYNSVFEPGSKAEYSNTNYVLLSFIAEDIEKKTYANILTDRITGPHGLTDTYYGSEIATDKKEAKSYVMSNSWIPATESDMSIPMGAGGIVSNPEDLNVFINKLFNKGLVSQNSFEAMTSIVDGFGIGLFKMPFYNLSFYGHNGGIDGFQSMVLYHPEDSLSLAYTSNAVSYSMNNILIVALSVCYGMDYGEYLSEDD